MNMINSNHGIIYRPYVLFMVSILLVQPLEVIQTLQPYNPTPVDISGIQLNPFNEYSLDPDHHLSAFPQLQVTKVAKIRDYQAPFVLQEIMDFILQQNSGIRSHAIRGEEVKVE